VKLIGNAFYFSAYEFAHHELGFNAFVAGGFAGLNSWFWSYPADVIKTRKQVDLTRTFQQIVRMGGLWNGLRHCSITWIYCKWSEFLGV
jgi:hypothetical protein